MLEVYIAIRVFFVGLAVVLVTTAALRGRTGRVSFQFGVALAALAVFWSVWSVSLLVGYPPAMQLAASFGSRAIYFFAFGASLAPLACGAALAAHSR